MSSAKTLVSIIMGSKSDWDVMQHAPSTLERLGINSEVRVLSAHRTPDAVAQYVGGLEDRGVEVVIGAAGGAAALAGVIAGGTALPVLGVPMVGWALGGLDSLLSTVQMPGGIPVATFAIGKPGAVNAAIFAAQILGNKYPELHQAVAKFRKEQTEAVLSIGDPRS